MRPAIDSDGDPLDETEDVFRPPPVSKRDTGAPQFAR
jgi:hypothetical protein